jgi:hypothetical protein
MYDEHFLGGLMDSYFVRSREYLADIVEEQGLKVAIRTNLTGDRSFLDFSQSAIQNAQVTKLKHDETAVKFFGYFTRANYPKGEQEISQKAALKNEGEQYLDSLWQDFTKHIDVHLAVYHDLSAPGWASILQTSHALSRTEVQWNQYANHYHQIYREEGS